MIRRLWWSFYCRLFLTAPVCAVKGHAWVDAMGARTCERCNHYRGRYDTLPSPRVYAAPGERFFTADQVRGLADAFREELRRQRRAGGEAS